MDENYPVESIIYELEKYSSHPIAKSLVKHLGSYKTNIKFDTVNEIKGKGFMPSTQKETPINLVLLNSYRLQILLLKKTFNCFLRLIMNWLHYLLAMKQKKVQWI